MPQKTSRKCHKCGSPLLLVDTFVEKVQGQYGDITTSIYNCSNPECKKETDAKIVELKSKKEEKEQLQKDRQQRIQESRVRAKKNKEKNQSQ